MYQPKVKVSHHTLLIPWRVYWQVLHDSSGSAIRVWPQGSNCSSKGASSFSQPQRWSFTKLHEMSDTICLPVSIKADGIEDAVQLQEKGEGVFESASREGLIMVTSSSCKCTSWMSMKLPCRRILQARSTLRLELYDESLCAQCWTAAYYQLNQWIFLSGNEAECSDVTASFA